MNADCDEIREITAEVALGVATGEERARALEHVATCADCRRELDRLAAVADEMLVLAPEGEPPSGFEERVLRQIAPRPAKQRRLRRFLTLPAVGLAGAALATGALLVAFHDDRQLASHYRQALAAANGREFVAVPLRDGAGVKRGSLSLYRGSPSWFVVTVRAPAQNAVAGAELVSKSGARTSVDHFKLVRGVWGGALPIGFEQVASLQLLDAHGKSLLAAYNKRGW
jgi:hypothetical protein